jgi:MFS family permease
MSDAGLSRKTAVLVFLALAFAYFLSAMVRAITATLSPTLIPEFNLHARDLGLLAGGYFLGFAATQLPLGHWLDRHGPKKVVACFLTFAVMGSLAFAVATQFSDLLIARILTGIGVSACLMAPLTGFRRWLAPATQLRANSWMLMTGSMGMLCSTLPVQWLLPVMGWRPMFWGLAGLNVLAIALILWQVPAWRVVAAPAQPTGPSPGWFAGYRDVWAHPYFRRLVPLGFFSYGGLLAMQTLWAGPWMVRVSGYSPLEAATGLFWINVTMLFTFWAWGWLNPWLSRRGWHANLLMTWGIPLNLLVQAVLVVVGPGTGTLAWALFCMTNSVVSLAQPAVGLAFPPALAGRALSAFNLVIFSGVFAVQWGFGLLVDGFLLLGATTPQAFQAAMGLFLMCSIAAYAFFRLVRADNSSPT